MKQPVDVFGRRTIWGSVIAFSKDNEIDIGTVEEISEKDGLVFLTVQSCLKGGICKNIYKWILLDKDIESLVEAKMSVDHMCDFGWGVER